MLNTILENKVVVCNYVLDIIHSQACKMIPDDTKLAKSNKAAISQLPRLQASRYSQFTCTYKKWSETCQQKIAHPTESPGVLLLSLSRLQSVETRPLI